MSRHPDPPLVDPASDPRQSVGLKTAARFLGVHRDTLRARIEAGLLPAWRDGLIYRIRVSSLLRYQRKAPKAS